MTLNRCGWPVLLLLAVGCGGEDVTFGNGDDGDNDDGGDGQTSTDTTTSDSGTSPPSPSEPCENGYQDAAETDVDCGGPDCAACDDGKACKEPSDCQSNICLDDTCAPPGCDDDILNGMETDVDCGGGSCDPCGLDETCEQPADCQSLNCEDSVCVPPSCTDGAQNGSETDIDCGGTDCEPCAVDQACEQASDCVTKNCSDSTCAEPTCDDGATNGSETDQDCGGSCPSCGPGQTCSDNTDCTTELCESNTCTKQCEVDDDCNAFDDVCQEGQCNTTTFTCEAVNINESQACDDGDLCTSDTTCQSGTCSGGSTTDCSFLDEQCKAGVCNPSTGECELEAANEDQSCDDLDSCTIAEVCTSGQCIDPQGAAVWLDEDFSDGSGWLLSTNWEIGAATQSNPTSENGGADPGTDHTADTSDDGVAGTLIGDILETSGGWYYLTSPAVDLSGIEGTLELSFWRWLDCAPSDADSTMSMGCKVEIYDGGGWIELWSNPGSAIVDESWVEQTFDITSYKVSGFRVRFGYRRGAEAPTAAGWNIDDIRIANPECTL